MRLRFRYEDIDGYCAGHHKSYVDTIAYIGSSEIEAWLEGESLSTIRAVLMKLSDSFYTIAMRVFKEFPFMTSGALSLDNRDNPMAAFLVV